MSRRGPRALALALLLVAGGCGGESERAVPGAGARPPVVAPATAPQQDGPRLGPYPRSQFYIEHDLFLAADDPRTVAAPEAPFLKPGDEVLGLLVNGSARAYPVTMLSYHHVVNDVIEGIPVAVTY